MTSQGIQEWRRHGTVVLASSLGVAVGSVHVYSLGAFTFPLEREFGWSRSAITAGLTINAVTAVLFSTACGWLIDRWGPRRIGIAGIVLICMSVALLSQATADIWSWWMLWILISFSALFIKPTVWTAAVTSLFVKQRGLALALTLSGSGLCMALTPFIAHALIERLGWRLAFVGLAVFWGMLALPVALAYLTSAADRRRRQRGAVAASEELVLTGLTAKEGFASADFRKLAGAAFLITLATISFTVSIMPILVSTGIDTATTAKLAGLVGGFSLAGRIASGLLLDRIDARMIAAASACLPMIAACLLIAMPGPLWVSAVVAGLLGLSLGAELDAVSYLAARNFGMRSFGTLFGTISGLLVFATGVGPLMASMVFDRTESYVPVLWAYIPTCLVAAILFLKMGRQPAFASDADAC